MAKERNSKKSSPKKERPPLVDAKTKRILWGISSITLGIIFLLGLFDSAGPAGEFLNKNLFYLFGYGEVLIPLAFFLLAAVFLLRKEANFYLPTFFGTFLIVLSILGILDLTTPDSAGLFGQGVGALEAPFGFLASLVILLALSIAGALLTFEPYVLRLFQPKEKIEVLPILSSSQELLTVSPPRETEIKPVTQSAESKETVVQPEIILPKAWRGKLIKSWQFPPLDLLGEEKSQPVVSDISANARIIQQTLAHFGIPVEMAGVHIGPTVTQYTLKPAQGVRLSKIVALHNDLALALAAHPLRIEAPIPGKALAGIEVPNKIKQVVRLRNLLQELSLREQSGAGHGLSFPLGRDVRGQAVFADLVKMPHLLVAGATGSGKSIFIHSLIMSLVYRIPPQLLKFIMIDPKRVELSQYDGMPYLLSPAITEGKKAVAALRWIISEMERRYDILLSEKARDIFSYNQKVSRSGEPLPHLVVFIDELADLMALYGREVETSIVRLSQMARATGIHLVVSTQRPSVEVITGLIKANITTRVAFQVASQVDSRTILDMAGAEKLLGLGDMLFLSPELGKPRRIQGPFVEEGEVRRVVQFIREEGEKAGLGEETMAGEKPESGAEGTAMLEEIDYDDELYPQAYEVVVQSKKASASLLQRRLKVGYARAARLLDILEAKGVIGPGQGAKAREVFVNEESRPSQTRLPDGQGFAGQNITKNDEKEDFF